VGFATADFYVDEILSAILITAFVFISLTIFACQTTVDLTMEGGMLFAGLSYLMLFSVIGLFFGEFYSVVVAGFSALIFLMYIIYDTQVSYHII
jgi:FtsH-binding integral membrane protein